MNPGPINVHPRVREALASCPDQCHREREYLTLQDSARDKLIRSFGLYDDYEVALLTGSGTAAMEAMLGSVVGTGVLVLDNGVYGDRLAKMAAAYGIRCKRLTATWFERHDPQVVREALEDGLDTIAVVHHETTTGLLNDVQAIADVAHETGRKLIVDSVSGLYGEVFDFGAIRPTAVCCTANKCLEGLPGIAFVFVRTGTELRTRSLYLSLDTMLAKQRVGDTPFTPAIQIVAALDAALDVLFDVDSGYYGDDIDFKHGGEFVAGSYHSGRIRRYRHASKHIRATMADLGIELMLAPELLSNTITCARLPAGVAYEQIWARLREDGFVIYAGQGDLKAEAFRVCNMGQIPQERLDAFGPALKRAIS